MIIKSKFIITYEHIKINLIISFLNIFKRTYKNHKPFSKVQLKLHELFKHPPNSIVIDLVDIKCYYSLLMIIKS